MLTIRNPTPVPISIYWVDDEDNQRPRPMGVISGTIIADSTMTIHKRRFKTFKGHAWIALSKDGRQVTINGSPKYIVPEQSTENTIDLQVFVCSLFLPDHAFVDW